MPQTPCLFAPADDRNARRRHLPAVQFNRSRRARSVWSAQRRCDGAPRSETNVKADLAYLPLGACNSSPSSRKVTPCHHLPRIKTFRSNN